MGRKLKINEQLANTASEQTKKLYNKLKGLEGFVDVNNNEKGSDGKYYWDFILKDTTDNIDGVTIIWVKGLDNGLFEVKLANDAFTMKKDTLELSYDKVLDLSDDLYDIGPFDAFTQRGLDPKRKTNDGYSYKRESLQQLRESLNPIKYSKIQRLIKECLNEGLAVEISIPKNKLNK